MDEEQLKAKVAGMTLEEKLLQMTQFDYSALGLDRAGEVTGEVKASGIPMDELRRTGTLLNSPCAEAITGLRALRRKSGVTEPVVAMYDVIHGYRTIYPVPLAMAGSFDMGLIEECAHMAADEAKYDGVDVTFSPMVDLVRDPRWGRVVESGGEDPYLGGESGKAFIRGYHDGGIGCCVKHFAGYGAAEAGRDYNTTDISEHNLREYYLRTYQECVKEKPELFMSSFNALGGLPMSSNKHLMVEVLRDEWGFDGAVISDWGSIGYYLTNHGVAENGTDCARLALGTKHDIEMCTPNFRTCLPELVKSGKVSERDIDEAVLRILKLKNKLGMYENPDRFSDPKKRDEVTLSPAHRALARRAARESIVLLKNSGVLPLSDKQKLAFVGPFYDSGEIIGPWAASGKENEAVTVRAAIEARFGVAVEGRAGCTAGVLDTDISGIDEAVEYAAGADVIVACLGEPRRRSGESHSRADIRVTAPQRELMRRLGSLGKPVVAVIFAGRPQVLTEIEPYADAILYAWHPGTEGGNAVVDLLFGDVNPSGKTAMTFPRSVGQCPIYYNHLKTGAPKSGPDKFFPEGNPGYGSQYDDELNAPLYPFGYGLSYTTFEYSDLKLNATEMKRGGKLTASVRVTNTGDRDGKEAVQWYIRDLVASYSRPVKEMKGFEKIFLAKGESRTVTFDIDESTLAFYAASGDLAAEAGKFLLFVGGNSRDCLQAEFRLLEDN